MLVPSTEGVSHNSRCVAKCGGAASEQVADVGKIADSEWRDADRVREVVALDILQGGLLFWLGERHSDWLLRRFEGC